MATQSTNKAAVPTLHHLNDSQSQRILWLLEELGIEYNLVLHKRTKAHRAPDEMKDVQELGKAPMLLTAEGRVIIESSTIVTYLLKEYDTSGKFATDDWIRDDALTSFAGSSIGPVTGIEMLFDMAAKHTPWPLVYLSRAVRNSVQSSFTMAEFQKDIGYLEKELGDKEWFNGATLGRSDFMLSWPCDLISQRGWVDFNKDYPKIGEWRQRIQDREAWKRGLEKGNGYNLTVW